jgi:hypothetical protein
MVGQAAAAAQNNHVFSCTRHSCLSRMHTVYCSLHPPHESMHTSLLLLLLLC